MALKAVLTKAEHDALPEPLKEHYAAKDDNNFVLDGFVEAGKFEEFRDTNRRMKTELEQARAKLTAYDGVDPTEYKHLQAEVARLSKAPAKDGAELEAAIARAVGPVKAALEVIQKERDDLKVKNEQQTFETTVTAAAQKGGILPDFVGDILNRARDRGFRLVDGNEVKAFKGDDPLRGDDGREVTLERFIKDQPAAFFGQTKGSGTQPNARGGGGPNGNRKILMDPSPLEMGRLAEKIASGEVEVRRST